MAKHYNSCVQCHSHPYDPIKHDEYYKLMAFFNNTMDEDLIDESPNLKDYSGGPKRNYRGLRVD